MEEDDAIGKAYRDAVRVSATLAGLERASKGEVDAFVERTGLDEVMGSLVEELLGAGAEAHMLPASPYPFLLRRMRAVEAGLATAAGGSDGELVAACRNAVAHADGAGQVTHVSGTYSAWGIEPVLQWVHAPAVRELGAALRALVARPPGAAPAGNKGEQLRTMLAATGAAVLEGKLTPEWPPVAGVEAEAHVLVEGSGGVEQSLNAFAWRLLETAVRLDADHAVAVDAVCADGNDPDLDSLALVEASRLRAARLAASGGGKGVGGGVQGGEEEDEPAEAGEERDVHSGGAQEERWTVERMRGSRTAFLNAVKSATVVRRRVSLRLHARLGGRRVVPVRVAYVFHHRDAATGQVQSFERHGLSALHRGVFFARGDAELYRSLFAHHADALHPEAVRPLVAHQCRAALNCAERADHVGLVRAMLPVQFVRGRGAADPSLPDSARTERSAAGTFRRLAEAFAAARSLRHVVRRDGRPGALVLLFDALAAARDNAAAAVAEARLSDLEAARPSLLHGLGRLGRALARDRERCEADRLADEERARLEPEGAAAAPAAAAAAARRHAQREDRAAVLAARKRVRGAWALSGECGEALERAEGELRAVSRSVGSAVAALCDRPRALLDELVASLPELAARREAEAETQRAAPPLRARRVVPLGQAVAGTLERGRGADGLPPVPVEVATEATLLRYVVDSELDLFLRDLYAGVFGGPLVPNPYLEVVRELKRRVLLVADHAAGGAEALREAMPAVRVRGGACEAAGGEGGGGGGGEGGGDRVAVYGSRPAVAACQPAQLASIVAAFHRDALVVPLPHSAVAPYELAQTAAVAGGASLLAFSADPAAVMGAGGPMGVRVHRALRVRGPMAPQALYLAAEAVIEHLVWLRRSTRHVVVEARAGALRVDLTQLKRSGYRKRAINAVAMAAKRGEAVFLVALFLSAPPGDEAAWAYVPGRVDFAVHHQHEGARVPAACVFTRVHTRHEDASAFLSSTPQAGADPDPRAERFRDYERSERARLAAALRRGDTYHAYAHLARLVLLRPQDTDRHAGQVRRVLGGLAGGAAGLWERARRLRAVLQRMTGEAVRRAVDAGVVRAQFADLYRRVREVLLESEEGSCFLQGSGAALMADLDALTHRLERADGRDEDGEPAGAGHHHDAGASLGPADARVLRRAELLLLHVANDAAAAAHAGAESTATAELMARLAAAAEEEDVADADADSESDGGTAAFRDGLSSQAFSRSPSQVTAFTTSTTAAAAAGARVRLGRGGGDGGSVSSLAIGAVWSTKGATR